MKVDDTVAGAGFVVVGAAVQGGTLGYPTLDDGHPGPALFPRILAGLTVLVWCAPLLASLVSRRFGAGAGKGPAA